MFNRVMLIISTMAMTTVGLYFWLVANDNVRQFAILECETPIPPIQFHDSISQGEINSLNDAMLKELQVEKGEVVSIEGIEGDEEGSNRIKNMTLTVAIQKMSKKGPQYDTFKLITTAEWSDEPLIQRVDQIGLYWSDDFTMYADKSYIWDGKSPNLNRTMRSEIGLESSILHEVDLQWLKRDDVIVLVAEVLLHSNQSGEATVFAQYEHGRFLGMNAICRTDESYFSY
ncbi:MAG: hypothetical protein ACRC5C_11340 [Bacilli bacterium]